MAHDDPDIKALRARFECVRVTQMNGVDLARFEFDYDTTWAAFFTDADLAVYSRYGGRDGESSDGRLTKESLLHTMQEVLEVHERRGRAPREGDLHPAPAPRTTPEDIPLLQQAHQGCVHCHQVQEYRLLQAMRDRAFERSALFGFPLPENIGLAFDRRHGHRVQSVADGSPAAQAGLQTGDVVTQVAGVAVRSEQDVRWALHRFDGRGPLRLRALRPGDSPEREPQPIEVELTLSGDWRQTDLSWRKSLRSVPAPWGFLGYALGGEERRTAGIAEDRLAIRVVSIRGEGLAAAVGLRKGDTIVSLAGNTAARGLEQFKSDLLRQCAPGDPVRVRVLREGAPVDLEGPFPDWHTTETSVP